MTVIILRFLPKMFKTVILLVCVIGAGICDNTDTRPNLAADELLSVVVIFRHGDRTPIHPYPNDPYKNSSYWPVGFGQLTNTGKLRQFHLGQWLRQRYATFLPAAYSEKDVYVRSTDVDRTLMSAEANLAGLYPPQADQIWDRDLLWQPIPIHTVPENADAVLAMKRKCPKFDRLLAELFKSPEFVKIAHQNHDLYAYLTRYTGTLISSLEDLEYIYNTLFIEQLYNLTLPSWAQKVFPDKLRPWAELSFATDTYTPQLARLKTGLLFNEIVEHFGQIYGKNYRKLRMYSAHDMTIASVLNTLGAFSPPHCPPYASTVIFEMLYRESNKTAYINVLYRNSTDRPPQKLVVKGCDSFDCTFDDISRILRPIILNFDQWSAECSEPTAEPVEWDGRFFNVGPLSILEVVAIVFVATSLGTLALITCFVKLRGSYRQEQYARKQRKVSQEALYTQVPTHEDMS